MTYPSGRVVDYNYATGGGCCNSRLDSVMDQTTDTTLLSARTYQAFGGTLTQTLGNGATQSFTYNSRLQLTRITAAAGGHTVMDFSYGYGTSSQNTGRVRSRTDAVQSEHSATYTYDSIYRLRQVQGADQSWGVSWTFDTWGNRLTQTPSGLATSKVGTQTLGYTSTTNRNTAFMYDAAGNQKTDGTHNYTFNAANQITQMDAGAAVYTYDGDGRRMKKTVGTETIYYFYAMGVLVSEFSTTNTGATGAASTDRTTYQTSDKLGTAVLLMAASGLVIENNRTLPYGEEWLQSTGSANEQKFTSYQRDGESGLDYAMNRYASNRNGRFQSVDPGPYLLSLPASLNRYVMTLADPVNYTDPDGRIVSVEGPSWNPATWFAERWAETIRSETPGGIYFEELETSTGPLQQRVSHQRMQTQLNRAVTEAQRLLLNPGCAGLFNTSGVGLHPASVLSSLNSRGGSPYGQFTFGYIDNPPSSRPNTRVYVNAQTRPTNPQYQIVNGVRRHIGFASVDIQINDDQNSPYNQGTNYARAVTACYMSWVGKHAFELIMGAGIFHKS